MSDAPEDLSDKQNSPVPTAPAQEKSIDRSSRKDNHVKFNPEVQIASLIFHGEDAPEEYGVPVHERLHKAAEQTVAEKISAAKAAEEARLKQLELECPFRPIIAADKAKGEAPVPPKINWEIFLQEQTEFVKRVTKKKQDIKADMTRDETTVPKNKELPRKTHNKIVTYLTAQKKYHGTVSEWERHFENFVARRQPKEQESFQKTPKRKSTGSGDSSVFEKLYEESALREAAQRVFLKTQLEREARELYKPMTNESLLLDNQTASSISNRSVEIDLIRKGEEYKQKREKLLRERQIAVEYFPFKPETNPKSREIILNKAKEQEQLALSGPVVLDESDRNHDLSGVVGLELSKPKSTFDVDLFTSKVQRRQALRQTRIAQLRREQKIQEVSECTFRPSISKHSDSLQRQRAFFDPFPAVTVGRTGGTAAAERDTRRTRDALDSPKQAQEEMHLQNLEEELRGVIAEWRYISGDV